MSDSSIIITFSPAYVKCLLSLFTLRSEFREWPWRFVLLIFEFCVISPYRITTCECYKKGHKMTENVVFLCNWYIYLDVAFWNIKIYFDARLGWGVSFWYIDFRDFRTFDRVAGRVCAGRAWRTHVGGACINLSAYNRWNNGHFRSKKGFFKLINRGFTQQSHIQLVLYICNIQAMFLL